MKQTSISGATIAASALTLALSATILVAPVAAKDANIKCQGVNACKGQAACKTANNECKGQAACKGQGWISASAKDCSKWGGKVVE